MRTTKNVIYGDGFHLTVYRLWEFRYHWALALHWLANTREMVAFAWHCTVMVHRIKVKYLKHTTWLICGNCHAFLYVKIINTVNFISFLLLLLWKFKCDSYCDCILWCRYGNECWTFIVQYGIFPKRWCFARYLGRWHGCFSCTQCLWLCH